MKTIRYIAAVLAALVLMASCTETIVKDQLYLSLSSYTFGAQGGELSVGVDANVDWTYVNPNDWVVIESESDTSLVLSVAPNTADNENSGFIEFTAGSVKKLLAISQLGSSFTGRFAEVADLMSVNFSRNGRYCGGIRTEYLPDGYTSVNYPVIIDTYTGERRELEGDGDYAEVRALSDDGQIIAISLNSGGTVIYNGEEKTQIQMSGYMWIGVEAMSSDGSIMVGYAQSEDSWSFVPVKWTNMEPEILELPETDCIGDELYNGGMARGCSADGSVIYGSEWNTMGLIYWKDGKMYFTGKEFATTKTVIIDSWWGPSEAEVLCYIRKTAENYSISPNGKYIAASYCDYIESEEEGVPATEIEVAVVIDTDENEVNFIRNDDYPSLSGLSVDNDGICYGGKYVPGMGVDEGCAMDFRTSQVTPISEWMQANYGIVVDNDRIVLGVSEDNNVISGWRVVPSLLGVQYLSWYYVVNPDKQ